MFIVFHILVNIMVAFGIINLSSTAADSSPYMAWEEAIAQDKENTKQKTSDDEGNLGKELETIGIKNSSSKKTKGPGDKEEYGDSYVTKVIVLPA